jgi:D-tyrosyl-tRNA(Tyr) deacylase
MQKQAVSGKDLERPETASFRHHAQQECAFHRQSGKLPQILLYLLTGCFCMAPKFMRAVVQRVSRASVTIANTVERKINKGLLVLLAVEEADTEEDIEWLSGKITRLRIFPDENGVMNRSVQEAGGDILVVSQFTLFASTRKGNRPSYIRSAAPAIAIPIYEAFVQKLTKYLGSIIQTGEFGADMQVELLNDGPVTIIIDSKLRE